MSKKKTSMIFICRKCGHNLYTDKLDEVHNNLQTVDCPNCGEEGYENWIFGGFGVFEDL